MQGFVMESLSVSKTMFVEVMEWAIERQKDVI
jgi:hypothetical protein